MVKTDGELIYNFTKDIREKNNPRFRWLLRQDRFGSEGLANLVHYVCENGDVDFLQDVHDAGIDVHVRKEGKTPLLTASEAGQATCVKLLLELMYLNTDKKEDSTKSTIEGTKAAEEAKQTVEKEEAAAASKQAADKETEAAAASKQAADKETEGAAVKHPEENDSHQNNKEASSPLVTPEMTEIEDDDVEVEKPPSIFQRICCCCSSKNGDEKNKNSSYDRSHPLYAEDDQGRNCLYLAIGNGRKEVVDIFLNLEFNKLQPLLEVSCIEKDKKSSIVYHDSPLRMMIRKMPDIAQRVLDKYIDRSKESESLWICHYNILDDEYTHECSPDVCQCKSKLKAKSIAKDNHPLMLAYKNKTILGHHLVASLLYHKWSCLRPIHFAMLAWYALFMAFITSYMLSAKKFQKTYMTTYNTTDLHNEQGRQYYLGLTLTGMSIGGVAMEVIQICLMRKLYCENLSQFFQNLLDWLMYICAVLVVCFPLDGFRTDEQWELGTACLLASWLNFLLHHPGFSNYLHMVAEVFSELWRFTLVFSLVLLMFGFTFAALLNNQDSYSTVFGAVIRTWTMMLGDISYGEVFHSEEHGEGLRYPTMTYIVFIIFLLLGLVITNMWTGFIINRLSEVESTAITRKLHMQLDYILTVEYFLPKCFHKWFVFTDHHKKVKLGTKYHPFMLVVSMLLGDMKFTMPSVDEIQSVEEEKRSKSAKAEDMIKHFQSMMDKLNSEEGEIAAEVASPTESEASTTAKLE